MEQYLEIEKSIIKKFRKEIWSKFVKAVKEYELIQPGDKIAVCISGGKDSMLLAKCMEELTRHGQFSFEVVNLVMDPGYEPENLKRIMNNLKLLHIEATVFKSDIFEVSEKFARNDQPCYLCARMRRGYLYAKAKELGCNKIALGHHFNDVVETLLLNMIYAGKYSGMLPKLKSDHFAPLELIRPLYFVKEADIIHFKEYHQLSFLDCACTVTKKKSGKRQEIKQLVHQLDTNYKESSHSIFKSMENVNLNTILGYQKDQEKHFFLEDYDSEE